jgi:hypothetical protein
MWNVLSQMSRAISGFAFLHDFPPFLLGLVGLMWLATGLLVGATLLHYLGRPPQSVEGEASGEAPACSAAWRDAA